MPSSRASSVRSKTNWRMSGTTTRGRRPRRRCLSSSKCSIIGSGCIRRSAMSARCSSKPITLSPFDRVHGIGGSSECTRFPFLCREEKHISVLKEAPLEVFVLPPSGFVEVGKSLLRASAFFLGFGQLVAPIVVVDHIEYVRGVSFGHGTVTADNAEVLVVRIGGLIAKIVAAGDHHAVVAKRIDDHNLVVNHCMAKLRQLLLPVRELIGDACDSRNQHVGRFEKRVVINAGGELAGCFRVRDRAAHEELFRRGGTLLRDGSQFLQNARRPWAEE